MQSEPKLIWRSPEEIVEIVFQRASVVRMNEGFQQLSGIDPFAIDQIRTVKFEWDDNELEMKLLQQYPDELTKHSGTIGLRRGEIPSSLVHYQLMGANAFSLSTEKELE